MLKNYLPQALKLVAKDKKASLRVKRNQEGHIKVNEDGQLYTKLWQKHCTPTNCNLSFYHNYTLLNKSEFVYINKKN